jgi:release factor glutamine methyltransferase
VLDVGTGSGILAIDLAKKFPELEIIAVDISPAALAVARKNAGDAGKIQFLESDLMENPALPERFQMIVANLPYIPTGALDTLQREVRHEPRSALDGGKDGLDHVRKLITQSVGRTRCLLLELGDGQAQETKTLCLQAGYALIGILPDFTQRERILVAEQQNTNG